MKISLCSQVKNRIDQLRQTFDHNIDAIQKNKNLEWVIVDSKSTDGIEEFIKQNLHLGDNRLHFYQTIDDVPYGQPIYKNFSARLSKGDYLFNLDIDNFIDISNFDFVPNLICCLEYRKGTHGRVGMPRDVFKLVGGYDESFYAAGAHDLDLINRCTAAGFKFIDVRPKISSIPNTKEDTMKNSHNPDNLTWDKMNKLNLDKLKFNIQNNIINPNSQFQICKFINNFKEVATLGSEF
jgi:glycosyltransferase involved in cell wall biosynthesis